MLKLLTLLLAVPVSATNIRSTANPEQPPSVPMPTTNDNEPGGRWAPLGNPLILNAGHEAGLMVNQPLIGFRHMNKEDSFALCPSNIGCASVPTNFFRNSPDFKESSCRLSEAGVQAINHEKYNGTTQVTKALAELCREIYSVQNCIDSHGAKTDKEYLANKEYITGVQCLRQQEEPFGCQCVPFSTPEITSHREELMDFMMNDDGTKSDRPAEFPLAQFMAGNDQDDAGTGATGGTGGATGATGSGATGEEVDPFATVEERVENVGSQ
jgi:hypothetical protein